MKLTSATLKIGRRVDRRLGATSPNAPAPRWHGQLKYAAPRPRPTADVAQIWPVLAKFSPGSTKFGQMWPVSANTRPNLNRSRTPLADVGQIYTETEAIWAISANFGPHLGQFRPTFGRTRPNLARHRPTLGQVGPTSAKFAPHSPRFGQQRTGSGQYWAEFDLAWTDLG